MWHNSYLEMSEITVDLRGTQGHPSVHNSHPCISQDVSVLLNCGMRAAARTDVRCQALSDEEVPALGCLYTTNQGFLLHDEIIMRPLVR